MCNMMDFESGKYYRAPPKQENNKQNRTLCNKNLMCWFCQRIVPWHSCLFQGFCSLPARSPSSAGISYTTALLHPECEQHSQDTNAPL